MSEPISQAEYKVDERCPMCEGTQVEGGSIDINNGHAYQETHCLDCGSGWTDVYKLEKYRDLHDAEGESIETPDDA